MPLTGDAQPRGVGLADRRKRVSGSDVAPASHHLGLHHGLLGRATASLSSGAVGTCG